MKFVVKLLFVLSILISLLLYSVVSTHKITQPNAILTPQQVATARETLQSIVIELGQQTPNIQILISQAELDVLADLAAHTVKQAGFETYISNKALTAATSISIKPFGETFYLNLYCVFVPIQDQFSVDHCKAGKIPISGELAEWVLLYLMKTYLHPDTQQISMQLFRQIRLAEGVAYVETKRPENLKQILLSSIKSTQGNSSALPFTPNVDRDLIAHYLDFLQGIEQRGKPLSFYIGKVFTEAQRRTYSDHESITANSAQKENQHALWALAAYFGNSKFTRLIGMSDLSSFRGGYTPTLEGRADLTLHFLYSAVLDQIGGGSFGLGIGELKELSDANRGGSGYSFADLAADKAGIRFSQFITLNRESAIKAQTMLAENFNQNLYFPDIAQLPEGLRGEKYAEVIDNLGSNKYKAITDLIDRRIEALPLYQ